MATCTLLAMPGARGLFRRAIAQSGAAHTVANPRSAAKLAEQFQAALGVKRPQDLRSVPVAQLMEAQTTTARGSADGALALRPVLDPETLPEHPAAAIAAGRAPALPLVIGTNRDEMNLFTMAILRELDKPMDDARAIEVLRKSLPANAAERVPNLLAAYRESRQARGLPHTNRALLSAIQGDLRFRIPSVLFAEANRRHNPNTFMYLFSYESPAMRGALRACHALEIPFVFGTLDAPFQDRFAGTGPAVSALSELMMDSWLAFARTDQPGHPKLGDWIPYDSQRRATMVFDKRSALEDAPFEDERAAWDGII
jgi:para-nitrobenzyl esterase